MRLATSGTSFFFTVEWTKQLQNLFLRLPLLDLVNFGSLFGLWCVLECSPQLCGRPIPNRLIGGCQIVNWSGLRKRQGKAGQEEKHGCGFHNFTERPQGPIPACFWHGSCPRSGISRSNPRSPAGTGIRSTGPLGGFVIRLVIIDFQC